MNTAIGVILYFFAALIVFITLIFLLMGELSFGVMLVLACISLIFIYFGRLITKQGIKLPEMLESMELYEEKETKRYQIIIKYIDKERKLTERKIEVHSIKKVTDDFIISAFCLLRNEERTFKLSNIRVIVDDSSGKVVNNIPEFLSNLIISDEDSKRTFPEMSNEEIRKQEIERINKEISENEIFKEGKVIHTMRQNAIAFSPLGHIGIFTDNINELKVLSIDDIIKISFKRPIKNQWGDYDDCFYCVINVKDLHNPMINISLDFEKEEAKEFYDEIIATYNVLKKIKK